MEEPGSGIPEEIQKRIFEPFCTTMKEERGTGLGLALCNDIVRQHGGEIRLTSTVGVGPCFEVVLPEETGLEPKKREDSEKPAARAENRAARVLLIDDETLLLKAYRRMLSPPHEVIVESRGQDALDRLRNDENFDVILCDLMMPKVDGPMIYEALAHFAPHLRERVIFCSGGAFTARTKTFIASVPNVVLEKPVSMQALRSAVADAARRTDAAGDDGTGDLPR